MLPGSDGTPDEARSSLTDVESVRPRRSDRVRERDVMTVRSGPSLLLLSSRARRTDRPGRIRMLPVDRCEYPAGSGGDRGRGLDALVDGLPVLGHAAPQGPGRSHAAGDDLQAAQGARRRARGEPAQLLPARLPRLPADLLRGGRRRPGDRGRPEAPGASFPTTTPSSSSAVRRSGSIPRSRAWRRWTGTASTT